MLYTIFILIFSYINQLKIKVMLESLLNFMFSIPYYIIGFAVAAILDIAIHYTKATSRFTLLEIWGCAMFWPVVVILFMMGYFRIK